MADRMMMDKDGNVSLVPMSTREQMALTMLKEIYQHMSRNGHTVSIDDINMPPTPEWMGKQAVSYADALLQALEGKL